ncbi:hypothetical protein GLOIN_2v1489326 [Rhizophagus irregularis DAOM 181602=DAOM 197198]|uniref:Uncharacterized protein n=1 Tax=Rhizophagus irregularis (strain DAOM 181602 / DAOM 197198 / MUCL 43194) TaxID=747089 RepID=A0A2P4NU10_RHIID|nr:hypothetical protein GLOIN_2v1489326 [Rhizophagus irregularis DAOM 181602=DAOM 197198]POG56627.1 hypothetical protein GLOIN_2v1489326 [Rhizophagus irregularis DAOM 181602=DAOM 197198]|eukprot:XP_025164351.1 hypothetical protein GLOIN_2v1489326 [Rhizophagus irregularis DAOM 181602=DAOM 197198]
MPDMYLISHRYIDVISRDIEERLQLILTLADPNIIFDLQTNNGFKGMKFNEFWNETDTYFNEQEKKFKCNYSANVKAITELFESIHTLDLTLTVDETTQVQIRHHTALIEFKDTHCCIHAYSFQVKKCNNITYSYCKPICLSPHEFNNLNFLSDPIPSRDNTNHYMPFKCVYGTETTEEYRPTYMQTQANAEPISKSILIGGKIRDYINCEDCRKRRYVYSDKSLNNEEQEDYQQALELYSYSCGAPIFPDDHY